MCLVSANSDMSYTRVGQSVGIAPDASTANGQDNPCPCRHY
jgi:hypothetical protein